MSESLDVYSIGSNVLLDGRISGRITAIFIRQGRVMYECVYWNERERNEIVVEEWEAQPDGDESRSIRVNPVL